MKGLPEKGQNVFVIAPSGATIYARVREGGDGSTVLAFGAEQNDRVSVLANNEVAIQYTNRRGICRIAGVAHPESDPWALRVDHTGKVQLIQRREFVRVDAMVPVSYKPMGPQGWTVDTSTVNVSGGGFMISGREGLREGESCEFLVHLDGEEGGVLQVSGTVVRETAAGLGIRFDEIDEAERDRVIRWVFARERLARQVTRDG
jgi:hypothetical protein